jgi:pimeloyl-ACP methyl ester carboxylesterase
MQEASITVNGLGLHYLEWGDARSLPVVLLHGTRGHAHLWEAVATRLASRFRVLALDLRGHGDSARPAPPAYHINDYANDVRAVVSALDLSPFVLVGHSMGAQVAMLLAGTGGLPLGGLAILDIEADPPPYQAEHVSAAGAKPARSFATLEEAIAAEARVFAGVSAERARELAGFNVRPLPGGGFEAKNDREAMRQYEQVNLLPMLAHIACPILLLRGSESTVTRHEAAEAMQRAMPRGRLLEIPGAGHQLIVEQPVAAARALLGWLDELGHV